MGIVWTIIIGFVIGLLARFITPGRDAAGFIITTALGIGGAFIGSMVGRALNLYGEGEPAGFLMSLLGAMLLLFIYNRTVATKKIA